MGESLKNYPVETLRKKLEHLGLHRRHHELKSLRKLLSNHFKRPLDEALEDVDVVAEILIYLHHKKMLSLDGEK